MWEIRTSTGVMTWPKKTLEIEITVTRQNKIKLTFITERYSLEIRHLVEQSCCPVKPEPLW